VIVDLDRFIRDEQPFWEELEALLGRLDADLACRLELGEVRRLHYLYQRACSDLARVATFSAEPSMRRYLETLVARAYGHVHASSRTHDRFRLDRWLLHTFPRTVRRHGRALALSAAVTCAGTLFGAGALLLDPAAKAVLLPFAHLQLDPAERVAQEESSPEDGEGRMQTPFAAFLMTNNVRVSVFAMAAGMTYGVGTVAVLFGNGVLLGAVCADYVQAGVGGFLAGWLLPHGAVEIPAILLAGQAGLVLAGALVGWGDRRRLRQRLRQVAADVVTLIGGTSLLLVWAACVEAFLSQYHAPVIPYWAKVGFGAVELAVLVAFLVRCGRGSEEDAHA
jgi:uncharacterized membrane protein SpoIIM required for sporulation